MMSNILVYAATGEQASPLLSQLQFGPHKVFALTRNKAKASIKETKQLEVVEASLDDAESLQKASQGMDVVMLNLPFFSEDKAGIYAIEAAKKAGVKLIIWNANGEVPQATSERKKMNVRLENMERLIASGIPYIVFQPTVYLENLLMQENARSIRENNRIEMVAPPEAPLPWISTQDISAAMVKAMDKSETYNKVYTVKGKGWNGGELASNFTKVLGREITYQQIGLDQYIEKVNKVMGKGHGEEIMGISPDKDTRPIRAVNFPKFSALDAFQELALSPTTLEDWVLQHKDTF